MRLLVIGGMIVGSQLLLAASSMAAEAADAQDRGALAADAQKKNDATKLEAVTVTATKRDVDIDTIPVAVTAIEGQDLVNDNIRDTQSLPMLAPSMVVQISGNEAAGTAIRIRGIGTAASNPGLEGSVGVFVDGVYRSRAGLALSDLVDIDHVEVLRGPQSTLFGKNTSAGVVSITTNKPTFTPQANVSASAGNYAGTILSAALSGPVVDNTLALRIAAQYNKRDGYIDNPADGDDYNDRNRWLVRGQALWTPVDTFSLRLIADLVRKDEQCCAAPYSKNGPTAAAIGALGGSVFNPVRDYTSAFDSPLQSDTQENGLAALADWDLGWAKASAIASYRDGKADNTSDGDYSDLNIAYVPLDEASAINKSAEFNLKGSTDRVDWLAGLYYGQETIGFDGSTLFGSDAGAYLHALVAAVPAALYPAGFGQTLRQSRQSGHNESIYTHNIVHLGGGFDLTLGLRYGDEKKDGWGYAASNAPACNVAALPASLKLLCAVPFYRASYEDTGRLTGVASLSKSLGDRATAYFTYSTGFKAGGINLDPSAAVSANTTFKPETVDAYELGLKMPLLDDRLQLRTDLFWMDFKDVQLNSYNGISFSISNAASARSRGVEVEADWQIADVLKLRGGVTYNNAVYGDDTVSAALRGKQLTNAPRRTALLALDYEQPVSFWSAQSVFANLAARAQSAVNTGADLDPNKAQGGYTLVNGCFGLRFSGDLEVSLWANNLTDRFYRVVIFNSVAQTGSYNGYTGLPRTFGIEVRKSFF